MTTSRENVLFVCLHGSAKSLIAAEYFNRLATARGLGARAVSAGTEPDDAIPPHVVGGLANDGIDVAGRRPRAGARRIERWDDVPAVSEDFAKARTAIVARVTALLDTAVPAR